MLDGAIVYHSVLHKPGNSSGRCLWEVIKRVNYSPESLYRNWATLRAFDAGNAGLEHVPSNVKYPDPVVDQFEMLENAMARNDWSALSIQVPENLDLLNVVLKYGPFELMPTEFIFVAKSSRSWKMPCDGNKQRIADHTKNLPNWLVKAAL